MGDGQNVWRAAPRTEMDLDVLCCGGRLEGPAKLKNLSTSGALLESATFRLAVRDSVMILIQGEAGEEIATFGAGVVRLTPDGFAVQFCVDEPVVVHQIIKKYAIWRRAGTKVN